MYRSGCAREYYNQLAGWVHKLKHNGAPQRTLDVSPRDRASCGCTRVKESKVGVNEEGSTPFPLNWVDNYIVMVREDEL